MHRRHPKCFIFIKEKITKFCVADAHRVFQHCREHGCEFARRTGDDLQYFRGGSLLLQRFTQLAEQPCILDCDDRLVGKRLCKFNLFVGVRPYGSALSTVDQLDFPARKRHPRLVR